MKLDPEIVALVCRPHCRFFREGEKEELSCKGYDFLVLKLKDGEAAGIAKEMTDSSPPERFEHDRRIEAVLCSVCDFRAEDCDFMGEDEVEDPVPCGGYVLIKKLLEKGCGQAEDWIADSQD